MAQVADGITLEVSDPTRVGSKAMATLKEVKTRYVQAVLSRSASLAEAARILGIDYSSLWRFRQKHSLRWKGDDK